MEPLSLHIGGMSNGLPLPPRKRPEALHLHVPSAGLALPDAPRDDTRDGPSARDDAIEAHDDEIAGEASDDEIALDDLLAFGGADAGAARRSLAFNAGKYDEAVACIAALGADPVKRNGKLAARGAADDAARADRAAAAADEFARAQNAVRAHAPATPGRAVGCMLGDDDESTVASSAGSYGDASTDDEAPVAPPSPPHKPPDTPPAVRGITHMRHTAAPDKYSTDYSRFVNIASSDEDEGETASARAEAWSDKDEGETGSTRAEAYRSMDFDLPKAPAVPAKDDAAFASVFDMCDELAPEKPLPDAERRDGMYFPKTNQFVPYESAEPGVDAAYPAPRVPADASQKLGALIERFRPQK